MKPKMSEIVHELATAIYEYAYSVHHTCRAGWEEGTELGYRARILANAFEFDFEPQEEK